jgi:hypothetical protein
MHRSRFVIMAGLPGTGKTALAEALAKRLKGIVLSKDKVRAALFPPGAITYSSGQNVFCMSVILMAAQRIAADHRVRFLFLDGRTFSRDHHVKQVVRAAATIGAGHVAAAGRMCCEMHRVSHHGDHGGHGENLRESGLTLWQNATVVTIIIMPFATSIRVSRCLPYWMSFSTTS